MSKKIIKVLFMFGIVFSFAGTTSFASVNSSSVVTPDLCPSQHVCVPQIAPN